MVTWPRPHTARWGWAWGPGPGLAWRLPSCAADRSRLSGTCSASRASGRGHAKAREGRLPSRTLYKVHHVEQAATADGAGPAGNPDAGPGCARRGLRDAITDPRRGASDGARHPTFWGPPSLPPWASLQPQPAVSSGTLEQRDCGAAGLRPLPHARGMTGWVRLPPG